MRRSPSAAKARVAPPPHALRVSSRTCASGQRGREHPERSPADRGRHLPLPDGRFGLPLPKARALRGCVEAVSAIASYAKQSNDDTLLNTAMRIKARALRRGAELWKQLPKESGGRPPKLVGAPPPVPRPRGSRCSARPVSPAISRADEPRGQRARGGLRGDGRERQPPTFAFAPSAGWASCSRIWRGRITTATPAEATSTFGLRPTMRRRPRPPPTPHGLFYADQASMSEADLTKGVQA